MLYMIESNSKAARQFLTRRYGMLLKHEAEKIVDGLNKYAAVHYNLHKFHITPVLDI